MLAVQLSNKRTGVTLTDDLVALYYLHMHLWQFALGTTNVLIDELVEYFSQLFLGEVALDDVLCIVFATSFFESSL